MKKTLFTMAAVAMMCAMVISGCNSPETQPSNSITNPSNPSLTLKGSVQGVVVDVRNNPIEGAVVRLNYPGEPSEGRTTNAAGQYGFKNVPVAGELVMAAGADAQWGNGSPYLITVQATGYSTTYTAVLLDYASLAAQGAIVAIGGELQAVGNLQSTAITARMPTTTAIVQGRMKNNETAELLDGVLCTLSLPANFVPNAELIWANGQGASVHAFSNNSTLSVLGMCEWLLVPEATDTAPITYELTRSLAGFVAGGNCPQGAACNDVMVGYGGGHIYALDAGAADYDPMTPYDMVPHQGVVDEDAPFATATNIPVGGEIAFTNLLTNLTVTFNEVMDSITGIASIEAVSFKNPGPLPLNQSWDATVTTVTMDPVDALPEGMNLEVSLANFSDPWQNLYAGVNPAGGADILTVNSGACTGALQAGVCVTLATSGDPTLTQAQNLAQLDNGPDAAVGPFGGSANNIPQANNQNVLDPNGTLGICAGAACGGVINETDTIFVSWDAATPATTITRQYELYAELATGGIIAGLPVLVGQTPKSNVPATTMNVNLTTINTALAAVVPPIPTIAQLNLGGLLFIDEGFSLQAAVIALNSNAMRGPYSNAIAVQDNIDPTVADLGCGWDSESVPAVDTCGLAPVNGTAETNLPIYLLTSGWGTTVDVNLQTLGEWTGGAGSSTYDAADYTAWSATGTTITVGMSEDLDTAQDPTPALSLTTASSAAITAASIPGTTNSRRNIAIGLSGAMLLSPGDTIAFANATAAILDETLNAAIAANATLVFGDAVVPLFVTAVASGTSGEMQQLLATYSEPMASSGAGDAEDLTLYTFVGVSVANDTAVLSGGDQTVTITTGAANPWGYANIYEGYDSGVPATTIAATNVLITNAEDLQGNITGRTAPGGPGVLIFQIQDSINPRITLGVDIAGVAINGGASAWEVGDVCAVPAGCPIGVQVVCSEPVVRDVDGDGVWDAADQSASGASAVMGSTIPGTYFAVGNANQVIVGATVLAYSITQVNGSTVANDDFIRVIAEDNSGNSMNSGEDTITLTGGAGGGYTID